MENPQRWNWLYFILLNRSFATAAKKKNKAINQQNPHQKNQLNKDYSNQEKGFQTI